MTLVDTGYLIALLNPKDELRQRVLTWSRASIGPLLVTEYVLLECVNALSSEIQLRPTVARLGEIIISSSVGYEFLPVDLPLLREGLALYRDRPDKRWSLTDCISFHIMRERGLTRALAYDHHFEQAGFEPLLRREP